MSLYKGTVPIAGLAKNTIVNGFHIFDCKWADHLLDDISWLRADTFSWQSGSVYVTAYNELVSEYNNASSTTETDSDLSRPNFTKVGNPTITNGVVSNFSDANKIQMPSYPTDVTSFEMLFKVKATSIPSSGHITILGQSTANYKTPQIDMSSSGFGVDASQDGSSWVAITGGTPIANTDYYVKYTWDGTQIELQISTDGSTYTSIGTANASTVTWSEVACIGDDSGSSDYWNGSIDLKESYIKINNQLWWTGYEQITYKRTPKGYKIADATQETAILNKYNTDGIAWYYILDTTNTQFKLPRTKFGFEGLRTNVGDDIAESLPNITGSFKVYSYAEGSPVGTFRSNIDTANKIAGGSTSNFNYDRFTFNASHSSSTYQDNAPVQERATQMYLYFYVGEYSQTAIEQTAGITSEQLNAKVDVASLSTINPMITSYVDPDTPTNGYNIWANGYCEQWGSNGGQIVGTVTTVSLAKTFANTNYIIKATGYTASSSTGGYTVGYCNKTTTSFQLRGPGNGNTSQNSWDWVACGYLAEGQY